MCTGSRPQNPNSIKLFIIKSICDLGRFTTSPQLFLTIKYNELCRERCYDEILPQLETPLMSYLLQVDKNVDQGKLNCPLQKNSKYNKN